MNWLKYIATIVCAIVALLIIKPFFDQRTPAAYVAAGNEAQRIQPTIRAAQLINDAEATRVSVVALAKATAEAASILANNKQRIDEDAHAQAVRHQGEMNALTISNTQRLNEIEAGYIARTEGIKASGAKEVAEANADAARASAGAWRDTLTYGGIAIGAVVALIGGTLALVTWLMNRSNIIDSPITGPILISRHGIIPLGNITTPLLLNDGREVGSNVLPLVAQRQAWALIGKAKTSDVAELSRAAQHSAAQMVQSAWTPTPLSDAAVAALPAGRDELANRVPTFAQLLRTWRPTPDQMIYGYDLHGQPVYGTLEQLLSGLVIGRQGQGKTTLLRMLYLQCLMIGSQVIAWDIHDDIAEDIPGIVTYSRAADIERSAQEINAELERRIRLKLKREKATPLMVLVDEVNEVVDKVPSLPDTIKRIVSEGRKYRMFEFVTAKGAPADIFKTSWARDSFSALFAFWTSSLQARNAGFESDVARQVETLQPGQALLRLQTAPAQVITFPDLPPADLLRLVSQPASTMVSGPLPDDFRMVPPEAEKAAETDVFDGVEAGNKAFLVKQAIAQGKSQRDMISEIWGATGGRAYQQAAEELRQIIQELVK